MKHPKLIEQLRILQIALKTHASDELVRILFDAVEEYRNSCLELISDNKLLSERQEAKESLRWMEDHPYEFHHGEDDRIAGRLEELEKEYKNRWPAPTDQDAPSL